MPTFEFFTTTQKCQYNVFTGVCDSVHIGGGLVGGPGPGGSAWPQGVPSHRRVPGPGGCLVPRGVPGPRQAPGPQPRGKLRGSGPGPQPRGKLRGILSRPTTKGKSGGAG